MKKLTFILLICSISNAWSQENGAILKLSPQHFLVNTMKIDFEIFNNPKSSIIFSPSMAAFDQDDEKVIGGGLELGKRFYVLNKDSLKMNGFYAQVSLQYKYFDATYRETKYWSSSSYYYGYDSITYTSYKETIHQLGGDFVFGYQVSVKNIFYIDLYFGGGMRMGISSRGDDTYYKSSLMDYAYNGIVPKTGVKLGLRI
jgi:hypothetical protein